VKLAFVLSLALAASGAARDAFATESAAAAAAEAEAAPAPPAWIERPDGVRFRVRFDPGARLFVGGGVGGGAGADGARDGAAPVLELGLRLRSERPAPGWDVHWKRDHELVRVHVAPAHVEGALYRGLFLRHSRQGTLTIPLSPPVALPLPFDVGLRTEVGRLAGPLGIPAAGEPRLRAGVVHGEALADFWRSPRHGRWLVAGVAARYDVGLGRDTAGALASDHLVAPMTAMAVAVHDERRDGLLAGGLRGEGAYRWSSVRGWEPSWRAEAEVEATPLAINDRPLSVYTRAVVQGAGGLPGPETRVFVGLRLSQPLR
jgi:hypothetical protein